MENKMEGMTYDFITKHMSMKGDQHEYLTTYLQQH